MPDPTPEPAPDEPTPPEAAGPPAESAEPAEAQRPAGPIAAQLTLDAVIDPSINFAALHNDVPAVKQLTLTNAGDTDVSDIDLRLWVDRELCGVWSHRLERLDAQQSITLTNLDLPLRAEALAHITERDSADLHAEVRLGDRIVLERVWPIDTLAFDEWPGIGALPELLACFVTPNHPVIERLLGEARLHLERATGDRALSGYQRKDPARVRATAEAIYRAVGDLALSYINPPASFEQTGQRIRLPDQMAERRMGTCLDLSLLLASLLEQAGLHPLIVMMRGHAFVGLWLSENRFPEPAVAEPLRLRKRVQLDEVLVIETTGLTQTPPMPFEAACENANRQLDDVDAFHFAVDIRTARARQIRPLPLRVKPGTYDLIDLDRTAHDSINNEATRLSRVTPDSNVPITSDQDGDAEDDGLSIDLTCPATAPRIENWKRKLLDLSLRNRVLNHRDTKKSIPLMVPGLADLEDRLAEGAKFAIQPGTQFMDGTDPRSAELHEQRTGEDAKKAYLQSEISDHRLHADLTESELDKRLIEIYRAARLGLDESGANTLYLAFGFLSWYESPTSEPARLAPILLIPASLERLPAGRGYRLSLLDEDPQINVTLLEKLRTEYNIDTQGLEELTEDEAGLDVATILRRFREAVKDIPRWDIVERVDLGLFSFNKFLMWRDLHQRSAELLANPVVRRLVDPAAAFVGPDQPLPDPAELDQTRPPSQTLCPMDADSSQLAAVFAANDGHSFVLEGPPGTGKSQTITNLIAHALSQGKRVLFVSEKRAALEVVHRRLEKIGLGPFCLELHSNKANKRNILEQLGQALDYSPKAPPGNWQTHAEQLQQAREQLNAMVQAMHRDRTIGLSVYQSACILTEMRDTPEIDLALQNVTDLTPQRFSAMQETVGRLATASHSVGNVDSHPYRAAGLTKYTASLPDQLIAAIASAEEAIQSVGEACAVMLTLLGMKATTPAELSADAMRWLIDLCVLLTEPSVPPSKLLTEPGFDDARAVIAEQIELGRTRDHDRSRLLDRYDPRVLSEDLSVLRNQLADGMTALPVIAWFKCYSPRKRLKLMLKPGISLPDGAALLDELDTLIRVREQTTTLASDTNPAATWLGEAWRKGEANWDQLLAMLDWAGRYRKHFASTAAEAFGDPAQLRQHMVRLAVDERTDLQQGPSTTQADHLRNANAELDRRLGVLGELMSADTDAAWGTDSEPGRLDTIATTLEAWRDNPALLRDWTYYRATRRDADEAGLTQLIAAHGARVIPAGRLTDVFRKSLIAQWHAQTLAQEPALAGFHRLDHERQIDRFRSLDRQLLELSSEQVRAELSKRLPLQTSDAHANSEVGILRRQMKLKRRHLPVRRLLADLPNLLPRLKPCFLMSPLSVAQYLEAVSPGSGVASAPFDLVVFDEASQIPVWDAVGALARGASCVVVGDSKQLPPTSFFQKLESDDDVPDENDFVELESILDECSASGLPSMRLLWHYRSRHESLIAFSNAHYYDHRLNTFPSPTDESEALGVSFKHIAGTYDRGKTCTNRAEAETLVADVVARLKQYDRDSYRSLGIVTFSMAQQTLIEDLLDQARRDEPAIDAFFTEAVDEPVFVKNLENVQGDERAAIYFSVCYGPDESGRVAMNFGPLNREGGERRLNVAITRARERVVVYSSLRGDQIDLSRTQAVGVTHLRAFLDYAERGASAMIDERSAGTQNRPAAIEHAIAQALQKRGYRVDLHVGLSGYRVALAVRDADRPDTYVLGIELDGPMYASAATARDRDRTRPSVMHGLGWQLHRLWSIDYLHDAEAELDRIEASIERARRGEVIQPTADKPVQAAAPAAPVRGQPGTRTDGSSVYEPFVPTRPDGDSEAYYHPAKTARVQKTVVKIAKREAPIHEGLLAKRLTLAWQVGRLTAKAAERAAQVIDAAIAAGELKRVGRFLWLAEQDPAQYTTYRVPADGDDAARDLDEVPTEELEAACLAVLRRSIALPRADLAREMAELFGLSRLTPRVQPIIDEAVQSMLDRGRCVIDASGKVSLP